MLEKFLNEGVMSSSIRATAWGVICDRVGLPIQKAAGVHDGFGYTLGRTLVEIHTIT